MLYVCVIQTGREWRVGTRRTSWLTAFAFIAVIAKSVFCLVGGGKRDRGGGNGECLMKTHKC
jgi:hypothetical protein